MASIRVLDDFFTKEKYEEILSYTDRTAMIYGAKSHLQNDPHGHWLAVYSRTNRDNKEDATPNLSPEMLSMWELVRDQLSTKSLITCYMNGHTHGCDGYFHFDTDEDNCNTAMLYIVKGEWDPDWGGETVFLDDRREIYKSVLPKANRLIVFPSNINHCARGVSRKYQGIRKTLIFKTRRDSK